MTQNKGRLETQPTTDFLQISDLGFEQIAEILDLAERMKASPREWLGTFAGDAVACYFEKPCCGARNCSWAAASRQNRRCFTP